MNTLLFESEQDRQKLLPLTYTRSIGHLLVGILTIEEKWAMALGGNIYHQTSGSVQELYPLPESFDLKIHAGLLPDESLVAAIKHLQAGQSLYSGEHLLASKMTIERAESDYEKVSYDQKFDAIVRSWDIFRLNGSEIKKDFVLLTKGRKSEPLSDHNTVVYGAEIFIEEGAKVKAAVLNAENGPIYIGKDAEVQEGSLIRGPFSLGERSVVNMGSKIKGDTSIGPSSKVGGEISNSVIIGNSNKGHDGFLGNSVIGEGCNLGADANNSNLKNNYAEVKRGCFESNRFISPGLQFCGLIMGDHSKCGINTMFNTGTTIGVSANIFGEGFPRNIIPSFSWGGKSGFTPYMTKKAFETAELVMHRRGKSLTDKDRKVLLDIFDQTAKYRSWEK